MAAKKTGPSFDVSDEDYELILGIIDRAVDLGEKMGFVYHPVDCEMDLRACHANGSPLRLKDLLEADEANFGHDVMGIRRHLDRKTGKLGGFFSPRFSLKGSKRAR